MIHSFLGAEPDIDSSCFVAPSAEVIGDVTVGPESSLWFNTTVRADVNWIRIGSASNVQDNSCIHVTRDRAPTLIGDRVTIGHSVTLHGCTIHDDVLVGMGAVVLDHVVIASRCIIGARALVTQRTEIPPDSLVLGSPGRVVRRLTDAEIESIGRYAQNYREYTRIYLGRDRPDRNPFYEK